MHFHGCIRQRATCEQFPLVQASLAGHRCMLAQPKVQKEPVTAEMLKSMMEAAGPEPLSEVRLLVVCLLVFAEFLRCEELLKLECADVDA